MELTSDHAYMRKSPEKPNSGASGTFWAGECIYVAQERHTPSSYTQDPPRFIQVPVLWLFTCILDRILYHMINP